MTTAAPVASGPILQALVARVEAAIPAMRAEDEFRPVHVLVLNHVLGTLLARALFSETGYLGIHCELPHEFTWRIAATTCLTEGLLPVPEEVDLAIVLSAEKAVVRPNEDPYPAMFLFTDTLEHFRMKADDRRRLEAELRQALGDAAREWDDDECSDGDAPLGRYFVRGGEQGAVRAGVPPREPGDVRDGEFHKAFAIADIVDASVSRFLQK